MANNSQKFDVGVEGCILSVMEAEEQLRKDVHEKNKQLDDQLDLQVRGHFSQYILNNL
jgi:hypothetical protein